VSHDRVRGGKAEGSVDPGARKLRPPGPDTHGVLPGSQWRGTAFVARYVVCEVAHRFGDELLLGDDWDGVHDPDPAWLDHLAGLLVAADAGDPGAEEQLSRLHAEDARLRPGLTVVAVLAVRRPTAGGEPQRAKG